MNHQFHTLSVEQKHLSFKPQVTDYQKFYTNFDLSKETAKEIAFFPNKRINAAYNAVERHSANANANKIALYFVDDLLTEKALTFSQLNSLCNQFGHYLRSLNVERGDRVFFFLPRIPAIFYGFLGTLKIGAIAGTMFSAFGKDALFDRLENSGALVLITTKELLPRLDSIRAKLPRLRHIITVETLEKELAKFSEELEATAMDPEEPAFMLYTSGTTGKPKGVIHSHNTIIQQHLTAKYVLDLTPNDIYWCTADPGWVTGIAYQILGTLSNAVTSIVFSGRFDPPTWYKIIEKYY